VFNFRKNPGTNHSQRCTGEKKEKEAPKAEGLVLFRNIGGKERLQSVGSLGTSQREEKKKIGEKGLKIAQGKDGGRAALHTSN